jgi:hypothetical protein
MNPEIEAKIEQVVTLAIPLPALDALRVYRRLREAADDLLQIIAAGATPGPALKAEVVVPIRPTTPSTTLINVKDAAARLGMSESTLVNRQDQPAFATLRVDNGTRKRLYSLERIEAFLRQRQG